MMQQYTDYPKTSISFKQANNWAAIIEIQNDITKKENWCQQCWLIINDLPSPAAPVADTTQTLWLLLK